MEQDEPITSAEAAPLFGVSQRTVLRMADSGELAYIRKLPGPNGDYLFSRAEVERAAAARAAKAEAAAT